ncbi:MAG: hypothetical protein COW84_03110 [Gammaproteobacteria bacterium CG22_combo_CG10-13_8_21_14_all_40_8]|nr:MAG: hypothetical protein COW84_03110 [Gammaproteobacteria bacterium CG22_combo_CG10-13_8_21_14_all_40_8]
MILGYSKWWFFFTIFILNACSESVQKNNILLTITKQDFTIKVPARGELEAVNSTNISMPSDIFEPQTIEWLEQENTLVKKGQVVARFDANKYLYQRGQERYQIDESEIVYKTKRKVLENEKEGIVNDRQLIKKELVIAQNYHVNDLDVYSRNEMIDAMKNQKYLESKQNYLAWRYQTQDIKSTSELELLSLQQQRHQKKLELYNKVLNGLEIVAPHDGVFVLKKNWSGVKPHVGDTSWPGEQIATLPDLSKLQAKIYILESEAAGVKLGQLVELKLDVHPQQIIQGEIVQLDSMAKPRENGNPIKYFEAVVSLNHSEKLELHPGNQLQAMIYVDEMKATISVPNFSIDTENGLTSVKFWDGNDWRKQLVKTGARNSTKTQIIRGLSPGDQIALFVNEGENHAVH